MGSDNNTAIPGVPGLLNVRTDYNFYKVPIEEEAAIEGGPKAVRVRRDIMLCLREYAVLTKKDIIRYLTKAKRYGDKEGFFENRLKELEQMSCVDRYAYLPDDNTDKRPKSTLMIYVLSLNGARTLSHMNRSTERVYVPGENAVYTLERLLSCRIRLCLVTAYGKKVRILPAEKKGILGNMVRCRLRINKRKDVAIMAMPAPLDIDEKIRRERVLSQAVFMNRMIRLTEKGEATIMFVTRSRSEAIEISVLLRETQITPVYITGKHLYEDMPLELTAQYMVDENNDPVMYACPLH